MILKVHIFELAQTCGADYLITGDQKHLLPQKTWKTTKIISSHQAQNILL